MIREIKEKVWKSIRGSADLYRNLALDILDHPELGYQEVYASGALTQALKNAGFEIQQPYGGLDTAFLAQTGDSKPGVYFLAEYDALPGVGHGCGHNLIGPAAVAAAVGIVSVLDQIQGTVGVIGTPAEEYLGQEEGKVKMLQAGAFQEASVVMMMHPSYHRQVIAEDLGFIACQFSFHGKTAHAAADPWAGRNALEGLIAAFNHINSLRQHVPPDVRIHGIIEDGGKAPNVIPDYASGQFMVRAQDPETLESIYQRVCDCARAGAAGTGTEVEIRKITTVYNTRINNVLNRLIKNNFAAVGSPITSEPYRMAASSDFGNVSQQVPGAMFMVDSHPEGIPWHSREVAEAAGKDQALEAMLVGSCVMAGAALDLLLDGKLLEDVKKDFKKNG